jgi:SAM-dependent methyltransferase
MPPLRCTIGLKNFSKFRGKQASIIELECAQSKWLPYFASHWNFIAAGLDESELGCQRSPEMLSHSGARDEIVCGDLFEPPPQMIGRFDIAFSYGLVEHFPDTSSAIAACAAFVKPGGFIYYYSESERLGRPPAVIAGP